MSNTMAELSERELALAQSAVILWARRENGQLSDELWEIAYSMAPQGDEPDNNGG